MSHVTDQDPDAIILHVSDIVAFEGCKRKWWWQKQYDSHLFAPALFIGNAVHAGLGAYYAFHRDAWQAEQAIHAYAHEYAATFEERHPLQTWEEVDADAHLTLALGMVSHYAQHDAQDPLDGDIVDVERRITVPVHTTHGAPIPHVYLTGQLDLILARASGIWIVDHKTFGARTLAENPGMGLEVDEQLTAYAYLWWRATGVMPKIAMYNVLVKQVPQRPRVLASGKLSIDKSQPTNALLVRQTIEERGLTYGPYLDYLAFLEHQDQERWFIRWPSTRNAWEIQAFERRLAYKVEHVLQLVADPDAYAYPAPSSYRCGHCPFLAPCKAADDGGDPAMLLETFRQKELWTEDHG